MTPAAGPRLALVDLLRGVAIVAMVIYHALWDLGPRSRGLIALDAATNPVLTVAADLIAGTFLALVGVSLVLAHRRGIRWRAFGRRLALLVAASAVVSLATWFIDPATWVRFGILHCIAACSIVGLAFVRLPGWIAAIGAVAAFVAPGLLADPFFNHGAWLWLGLSTAVPPSVDYVPVLPWLGVVLAGIALAKAVLALRLEQTLAGWRPRRWLGRGLAVAGRWSLAIYVVHQPLLMGVFYLLALVLGRA